MKLINSRIVFYGLMLLLFLLVHACQPKETNIYYINSINGDDSYSGQSIKEAWRTLNKINTATFSKGDKILLHRGQTWDESLVFHSSGDSENPIVIGAYGKGELPVITRMNTLSSTWVKHNDSIWRTTCTDKYEGEWDNPWRLLINEVEILSAINLEELKDSRYHWFYDKEQNVIYLRSEKNPEQLLIETNLAPTAALFSNVHDIIIRDIDFRGGYYRSLGIEDSCYNIQIINCKMGKYARMGIAGNKFYYCTIDSCTVDSHSEFDYDVSSQRGTHDGIGFWGAIEKCEIKNTTIRNWGHTCITLSSVTGPNKNNKIFKCLIESPGIPYGRAIETDGPQTSYNDFYENIIRDFTVRSQIGGSFNRFHHNLIYNYKNSLIKTYGTAQAFSFQGINADAIGNIIEYNTIANIDEAAIQFIGDWGHLEGNIIRNNTIYNAGINPRDEKDRNIAMVIPKSKSIDYQIFIGNCLFSRKSGMVISYKGKIMNVEDFNNERIKKQDTIIDNRFDEPRFKDAANFNFEIKERKSLKNSMVYKLNN